MAKNAGIETDQARKSIKCWSVGKEAILADIGNCAVLTVLYIAEDACLRGKGISWQTQLAGIVRTAEGTVGDIAGEANRAIFV